MFCSLLTSSGALSLITAVSKSDLSFDMVMGIDGVFATSYDNVPELE